MRAGCRWSPARRARRRAAVCAASIRGADSRSGLLPEPRIRPHASTPRPLGVRDIGSPCRARDPRREPRNTGCRAPAGLLPRGKPCSAPRRPNRMWTHNSGRPRKPSRSPASPPGSSSRPPLRPPPPRTGGSGSCRAARWPSRSGSGPDVRHRVGCSGDAWVDHARNAGSALV